MNSFAEGFRLVISGNPELWQVIYLSLQVSLSAVTIATCVGLSLAIWLSLYRSWSTNAITLLLHTLLGLPPVVVGLVVYLLLNNQGFLGGLGLLFTPTAMIIAQVILVVPIIAAYSNDILNRGLNEQGDYLRSLGAHRLQMAGILITDNRHALTLVLLHGFGRAISEVGAVMIVGGNILHYTRVMTSTITLATAQGDLGFALALGLVLLGIGLIVTLLGHVLRHHAR